VVKNPPDFFGMRMGIYYKKTMMMGFHGLSAIDILSSNNLQINNPI
jgi:hypothetical protein